MMELNKDRTGYVKFKALSWLLIVVIYMTSCGHRKDKVCEFESIGLQFRIHYEDSTRIIYFGDMESDEMNNYFEVLKTLECEESLFYAIIDNTEGQYNIKHLIFSEKNFFDFHIRDYEYDIYQFSPGYGNQRRLWDYYTKDRFPDIEDGIPKTYIAAEFILTPYSKSIRCNLWDLGIIDDLDKFLKPYVTVNDIFKFPEMKDMKIVTDFSYNKREYGDPAESEYVTVTDINRKHLFSKGWLFLDTINPRDDIRIMMSSWDTGDSILTIFYRNDKDGLWIPCNGARYMKHIKTFDCKINYK